MTIITNAPGKIWMSLQGRLEQWTNTPVHYPNEVYNPVATDSFIIAQHITADYGGVIPVDADCGQPLDGILNLSVMAPISWTFGQHIGLASTLADHFGPDDTYSYSDITVKIRARSRVIGPSLLNAPWNRLEVQAYWRCWG